MFCMPPGRFMNARCHWAFLAYVIEVAARPAEKMANMSASQPQRVRKQNNVGGSGGG
jgi:hypothetical protein